VLSNKIPFSQVDRLVARLVQDKKSTGARPEVTSGHAMVEGPSGSESWGPGGAEGAALDEEKIFLLPGKPMEASSSRDKIHVQKCPGPTRYTCGNAPGQDMLA